MKLMLGLLRPTAGTIAVLGDDPAAGEFASTAPAWAICRRTSSFNPALTGRETLAFYARLKGQPVADGRAAARPRRPRQRRRPPRRHLLEGHAPAARPRPGAARRAAGAAARRADHRPRPGAAPALLRHRRGAARTRRHRAPVLARADRAGGAGRSGDHHEPRPIKVADGSLDDCAASPACRHASAEADGWRTRERLELARHPCRLGGASTAASIEIDAAPDSKIELLRRVATRSQPIEDLDVLPPTLDELYAHFLRGEARCREERPDRRRQGDPGGPAQPLGARHHAAAGRARPDADLPRQRADRQRRRAARSTWSSSASPASPSFCPADRAADLARRHRRRDGARHDAAAPELPGGALAGAARQVRRPSGHPRLRDARSATAPPRWRCRSHRARPSTPRAGRHSPRWSAPRSCSAPCSSPSATSSARSCATGAPPPASPSASGCCSCSIYDMALLGLLVVDQGQHRLRRLCSTRCCCSTPPTSTACST